jgi:hypothetical protein
MADPNPATPVGRPPTGRGATSPTPLSRFIARIETRIAEEKALVKKLTHRVAPTKKLQQLQPQRASTSPPRARSTPTHPAANIPPEQFGSLIPSPMRHAILGQSNGGASSSSITATTFREPVHLDTPEDWIAEHRDVLAGLRSGQGSRADSPWGDERHADLRQGSGALFRPMLRNYGLRAVGVRRTSALERALLTAPSTHTLLHAQRAAVDTHRVL